MSESLHHLESTWGCSGAAPEVQRWMGWLWNGHLLGRKVKSLRAGLPNKIVQYASIQFRSTYINNLMILIIKSISLNPPLIHDISQRGQRICFAKGGPSGSASAPPATRSPPRPTSPATAQRRRRPGPTSTAPWRKCPRVMLPVRSLKGGGKHETIWNTWKLLQTAGQFVKLQNWSF